MEMIHSQSGHGLCMKCLFQMGRTTQPTGVHYDGAAMYKTQIIQEPVLICTDLVRKRQT